MWKKGHLSVFECQMDANIRQVVLIITQLIDWDCHLSEATTPTQAPDPKPRENWSVLLVLLRFFKKISQKPARTNETISWSIWSK